MKDQSRASAVNATANTHSNQNVKLLGDKPSFSQRISSIKSEYGYLGLAALIPAIIFFLIYLARGLYPFGSGTVLVLDLNGQYVYFFEALRDAVLDGGSLLYSWSRSLGGEFIGMYAYYIASPLSYLICLFPVDKTQEFLLIMFMIKAAICGTTMGFYLHKHSVSKNKFTVITFAIMYALSAYCVVHQSNTMWIDAVMWLPLVALGVEELVKHGKYKMFVIFLSLTLASNFYIGYMVCIFVLLYYFFYMFAYTERNVNNPRLEKNHFGKSFVRIAVFSVIAVCMAAVIVFGAYYSLQFGKNEFTDPNWEVKTKFDFFDLIFKLFPASYDTVRIDGLPFVYCGLLTVILAPIFFCSKRFTLREKIASGIFLLIFVFSFMITSLDLIWHGFQKPQWLNARFSFMFCFFLIYLAFRTFDHVKEIKPGHLAGISGLILIFIAVLQKFDEEFKQKLVDLSYGPNEEDFLVHPYATILLTVILLVVYVTLIALMFKVKNKELVSAVMLCVVCGELFISGLTNVNDFDKDVGFTTYQSYNEFNNLVRPVTETLTEDFDTSFYRFEKTYHRKLCDNMALDIRGVSNSTSTLNKSTINFLRMLGYYSQSHKSQYKGGTIVTDSLLGMKYIISDRDYSPLYGNTVLTGEDYAKHEGMTLEELQEATFADKYKDYSSDDLMVYYNKYALSLAFAASDDVLNVNMKDHNIRVSKDSDDYEEKYNPDGYTSPFTRVNAFFSGILGEEVEIFKPAIQTDVALDNVKHSTSKVQHGDLTEKVADHDRYDKIDKDKAGTITYTYTVPEGEMLYLFFPAYYNREVDLSAQALNTETGKFEKMKIFDSPRDDGTINHSKSSTCSFAKCNDRIVELGFVPSTEYKLTVTIDNTYNQFYTKNDEAFIYYVDMELFEDVISRIKQNEFIIDDDYKEDDLPGTIKTAKDDQLILTTIPYDEGWNVYVDGEKVDVVEVGDALLAFRIDDAGEHTLRLKYRSNAFTYGIIITIAATALFVLIIVFERKWRKVKLAKKYFVVEGEDSFDGVYNYGDEDELENNGISLTDFILGKKTKESLNNTPTNKNNTKNNQKNSNNNKKK